MKKKRHEPYPGYRKEAAAAARKAQAFRQAGADPAPGPVLDAFAGVPEEVAGLRVRKIVHYDFMILRILNSPLLTQLSGAVKGDDARTEWTDDQGYEMIYQFTQPVEALAKWFGERSPAQAAKEFRALARREIGFKLGPVEVGILIKGVQRQIVAAFTTALSYAPREPDKVFPTPPAGTGSAGGPTTSAG